LFPESVHRDERDAGATDICSGLNLTCHSREGSFATTHDKNLVWSSGPIGSVPSFAKPGDREIKDIYGR
jgi:hypothetical protein